jgi:hypothetical protein
MRIRAAAAVYLALIVNLCGVSQAAIVEATFTIEINSIAQNTSPFPIAVGDKMNGTVVIDTDQASMSIPAPNYAQYAISGGSSLSLTIDGNLFTMPVNEVDVLNNYPVGAPNPLDRFFVNAGDITVGGSGGMQFWIDDQPSTGQLPTMLTSLAIPDPLAINLSQSTSSAFVFRFDGIDIQGDFISFQPPVQPTVVPSIEGTLGNNGWYTSVKTTLVWTVTGYPVPVTSGCGTVSVPQTKGITYICSATNSLGSASQSVMIKKDSVKPQVTIRIPVKGKNYALHQKALASYSCLDATSGVATCKGTVANGTGINTATKGTKAFTVVGTDNAGNKKTVSILYNVN